MSGSLSVGSVFYYDLRAAQSGILQGSHLGPLLKIVKSNLLIKHSDTNSRKMHFLTTN